MAKLCIEEARQTKAPLSKRVFTIIIYVAIATRSVEAVRENVRVLMKLELQHAWS